VSCPIGATEVLGWFDLKMQFELKIVFCENCQDPLANRSPAVRSEPASVGARGAVARASRSRRSVSPRTLAARSGEKLRV